MAAFFTLLLLCVLMGLASFFSGLAPFSLNLSPQRIRLISSFGIGILVGTALIVIIPEGVDAIYSAAEESGDDNGLGSRRVVGPTLVLGFVMMYLIDRLPEYFAKRKNMPKFMSSMGIDMSNLRFSSANSNNNGSTEEPADGSRPLSTVLGMLIHSIADGIALGASVASGNAAVEMVVFVAIMVHKAPASFGFTAVLLREGASIPRIKRALILFASGAPFGALSTFLIIKLISSVSEQRLMTWTGILLLFSGGTFLFVAVHAMQEMHESGEGPLDGQPAQDTSGVDIALSAAGMTVPLLTLLLPHAD